MHYTLETVTPPPVTPITLAEAKANMIIEHSDDDTFITSLVAAASSWVASYLNIDVVKTDYKQSIDCFPEIIELFRSPIQEVTSITYLDTDNVEQTLATSEYEVDLYNREIYEAYNVSWPSTLSHRGAVRVNFSSGFYTVGSSDFTADIPQDIKSACLLIVGDLYEHRERQQDINLYENDTAKMLLDQYRYIPI